MTTQGNAELVERIYEAIGRGDIPNVLAAMADDVEIRFPGPPKIPFAGTFKGHPGVGEFFAAIGANVEVHEFEPREFIAQGEVVVVLGHERLTAKPTGRTWDTDWAMAWTVKDGKVGLLHEYHQTDAIAAAFKGE